MTYKQAVIEILKEAWLQDLCRDCKRIDSCNEDSTSKEDDLWCEKVLIFTAKKLDEQRKAYENESSKIK